MFGKGVGIGRLAGIPISIHPLWLVIVALITWSLGEAYYPEKVPGIAPAAAYGLGLASALLFFASILLHELGHAVVARRYGVAIEGIQLWLLGGVARMKDTAHQPDHELRFALAGPAVTLAIVIAFGLATAALPASAPEALSSFVAYQASVNLLILVFNLLPAFPLDGGRVLRALLWRRSGDIERATVRAAAVGRGFAYALIALGFAGAFLGAPGLLWLGLIGVFLILAGGAEEAGVRLKSTLRGLGLRRVMAVPAATLKADAGV
jgi:Zn-dependent protease